MEESTPDVRLGAAFSDIGVETELVPDESSEAVGK